MPSSHSSSASKIKAWMDKPVQAGEPQLCNIELDTIRGHSASYRKVSEPLDLPFTNSNAIRDCLTDIKLQLCNYDAEIAICDLRYVLTGVKPIADKPYDEELQFLNDAKALLELLIKAEESGLTSREATILAKNIGQLEKISDYYMNAPKLNTRKKVDPTTGKTVIAIVTSSILPSDYQSFIMEKLHECQRELSAILNPETQVER